MPYILGIDTGGTYTDGALLSFPEGKLLEKTKTPTLHHDLKTCIASCVSAFKEEYQRKVIRVCLSTTLATNAIVEDNHCPTGLLLLGETPEGILPTKHVWKIDAKPDILGRIKKPLETERLQEIAEEMRGKVQSAAVSGYASVRNPLQETAAADYIREKLGIPVVCAHELTGDLGYYERTVTAVLNAGLIPLIKDLIDAVEEELERFQIKAPLMIVRGNSMLMSAEQARMRPIETILSGPAASITGGMFLSGQKDAMILDMGGTTTDMARVSGGRAAIRPNGAYVGGWNTRVQALEVFTCGLGGDSGICRSAEGELEVGTKRVIPCCRAAVRYPELKKEIQNIWENPEKPYVYFQQNDLESFLLADSSFLPKSEAEEKIRDALADGPHTVFVLREKTALGNVSSLLEKMIERGELYRIAMTPTDLLHALGEMQIWDTETPRRILQMWAAAAGIDETRQMKKGKEAVWEKMTVRALESAFFFDGETPNKGSMQFLQYLTRRIFMEHKGTILDAEPVFRTPVVAIGAPAAAWAGVLGKRLHTEVIFPEHAEVAGAVGAAVSQILEQEMILIRYDRVMQQYLVFSAQERRSFPTLSEAEEEAKKVGTRLALERLPGKQGTVSIEVNDLTIPQKNGTSEFVERRVVVTAVVQERG